MWRKGVILTPDRVQRQPSPRSRPKYWNSTKEAQQARQVPPSARNLIAGPLSTKVTVARATTAMQSRHSSKVQPLAATYMKAMVAASIIPSSPTIHRNRNSSSILWASKIPPTLARLRWRSQRRSKELIIRRVLNQWAALRKLHPKSTRRLPIEKVAIRRLARTSSPATERTGNISTQGTTEAAVHAMRTRIDEALTRPTSHKTQTKPNFLRARINSLAALLSNGALQRHTSRPS